jgi:hypothetical protein
MLCFVITYEAHFFLALLGHVILSIQNIKIAQELSLMEIMLKLQPISRRTAKREQHSIVGRETFMQKKQTYTLKREYNLNHDST